MWKHIAFAIIGVTVAPPGYPCGGIFDVDCNLRHGGLSPGNIQRQTGKALGDVAATGRKAVQDVANALNELQASALSGPTLEAAIQSSHDSAQTGAQPIPPAMRQQLTGYASEDSMNRVRYKVGDNGFVNLARLLEQGGAARAVTLIDVVVFRTNEDAQDPATWAHELMHVDQYHEWGLHSFAVQYARNANAVENPAYAKENGYDDWVQQNQRTAATTPIPAAPPLVVGGDNGRFISGAQIQQCGCWGPTTGINADNRCTRGASIAVACQGFCAAGGMPYRWICQ
ncbi:eCIS core domain-containing protein [Cupriavidus taiwanensis]|nr:MULTISPECIES: DUF4157 domain-containing protein [Cupriavidus]